MEIEVARLVFTEKSTIGLLSVDGVFACYSLEDCFRAVKIPGQTAIPFGRYEVQITPSKRFKRDLPILLNVPNFEGVRIHPGNTDADTAGCILVGLDKGNNLVGRSHIAFDRLFPRIQAAIQAGEAVYLNVEHAPMPEPVPQPVGGFVA